MKIPKIFVISLKESPRRHSIKHMLNSLSLDFEFFDATYGKDLTEDELKHIDFNFYPERYNARRPLTLGEIGCAISHIKVYEHIVENKIQEAIILEDDAILSSYFEEILLDALNKIPKSYEILFLDHGKGKIYPFTRSLAERYRLAKYVKPSKKSKRAILRATGYLITQVGARKLLNYAYPIRMPADFLTGSLQLTHINAYGIEPACIFGGLAGDSEINQIEDRYSNNINP